MLRKMYNIWTSIVNYKNRRRLAVRKFSIVANSCIGSVIYHKLGIPFQTPFIGISWDNKDFPKLASNLKNYMLEDLSFIDVGKPYPTALLGDVLLHFEHYVDEKQARFLWNKRKTRLDYDSLYFIMSDRPTHELIKKEDILLLRDIKCRGKVVFSILDIPEIDYIIHLPKDEKHDCVNDYMKKINFWGHWEWEKYFNYVNWLNLGYL